MANTEVQEHDGSASTQIVLDGRSVDPEEFSRLREEINSDPNRKLTEVSPGVYKTLQRLND